MLSKVLINVFNGTMIQRVKNESKAMILRSVAYGVTCFMKVLDFDWTWSIFVYNSVFNGTMFQGVEFGVDITISQACSLWFDLFHEGFWIWLNLVHPCLQYRFNGTMFRNAKFRVGSTNSQVYSLWSDLFHEAFWFWLNLLCLCQNGDLRAPIGTYFVFFLHTSRAGWGVV